MPFFYSILSVYFFIKMLTYTSYGGGFLLLRIETSPLTVYQGCIFLVCLFFLLLFAVWAEPHLLNNKKFHHLLSQSGLFAVNEQNGGILWAVSASLSWLGSIRMEMKPGALSLFSHESSHLCTASSRLAWLEPIYKPQIPFRALNHQRGALDNSCKSQRMNWSL